MSKFPVLVDVDNCVQGGALLLPPIWWPISEVVIHQLPSEQIAFQLVEEDSELTNLLHWKYEACESEHRAIVVLRMVF